MKISRQSQLTVLSLILAFGAQPGAARADALAGEIQADDAPSDLGLITDELIAREIDLQKVNAAYRVHSLRQPPLRPWRQFLYTEANASCTETFMIMRMLQSYPYMHTPPLKYSVKTTTITEKKDTKTVTSKVNSVVVKLGSARSAKRGPQAAGATVSMVGQLFSATGESYELSSNIMGYLQDRRHGLSSGAYRKNVQALAKEIDELLARRTRAIEEARLSGADREIADAETDVLRDVRDLSMVEFSVYHSNGKSLALLQNGIYVGSIAKNLVGASGNMVNINSSLKKNPKLGAGGSLLSMTAGVIIVSTPITSRLLANLVERADCRILNGDLGQLRARMTGKLVEDRQVLANLLSRARDTSSAQAADASAHDNIYSKEQKLFIAEDASLKRQGVQAKNRAIENVSFQTAIGGSRISQGVLGMIGGWQYPTRSWMRSRYTAPGATAYGAGTAINIVETARMRISSEIERRSLRKLHLLPTQVLADRIDTLKQLKDQATLLAASDGHRKQASVGAPH